MQTITTIGLDIAKSFFQVHGVDAGGQRDHPGSLLKPKQTFISIKYRKSI
jgi:transposase